MADRGRSRRIEIQSNKIRRALLAAFELKIVRQKAIQAYQQKCAECPLP